MLTFADDPKLGEQMPPSPMFYYRQGAEGVFMNKKHNLDELKVAAKVRFISKPEISV